MVDFTKNSDTNLEEMSHVLEDLDSLDMDLFNNSFKKSTSSMHVFKDSNERAEEDNKKRVIFKDINADGSLSGLLSDEENSLTEKKNLFKASSKSGLMEDLFKIKTPVTSTTSIRTTNETKLGFDLEQGNVNQPFSQKQNIQLAPKSNSVLPSQEKTIQNLQKTSENKDVIITNLFNKSGSIVNSKSKRSSLREDLFGIQPQLSVVTDTNIQKVDKNEEPEFLMQPAHFANTVQKPKSQPFDQSVMLSSTKEPRRGRRNTKILHDPLGLLSNDLLPDDSLESVTNVNMSINDIQSTHNSKADENLPEWLGGTKKLQDKKMDEVKAVTSKKKLSDNVNKVSTSKENIECNHIRNSTQSAMTGEDNVEAANIYPETYSLLYNTQFNQQTAVMSLQQQEHELRTAAILSQQNEQLSEVSNVQQSLLYDQNKQFNTFLKLQIERQALLEKQIKLQQERINQYIQVLMAQPTSISSSTSVYTCCKSEETTVEKDLTNENQETETIIKKLQLEKSKLESKLSTINEKHDNEMTFQAEFYKKEISFLKEGLTRYEKRASEEVEFLEAEYMTKLEKSRNEKLQIEIQYKEEIDNLKKEHAEHVEELQKLHIQNTKLLQGEYSNIIENLFRAKQIEDEAMKNMTNRKTEMEDVLEKANFIFETIKANREELDLKESHVVQHQENYLRMYQDNIAAQELELKNQNNVLVEYRNKFMETSENFDARLTQLISELQKKNTQFNQAHEALGKITKNLQCERELFEEKVQWERNFLQGLKKSWEKEQERQMELITEERKAIAEERSQLQVMDRLKINSSDIAREELETAIKIAQDATATANKEKLKWQEKIRKLDIHEQMLQEKENVLILRAKELENLTQSALIKKEEGIRALKDAKQLEHQHREKCSQLQMHLSTLMEREKSVAMEKYNVAKESISLTYETEKPERDVPYTLQNEEQNVSLPGIHSIPQVTSELMNIVDPNLIMLKLNLEDQFDYINKPFRFPNFHL